MQREIKFRGKRVVLDKFNEWLYGYMFQYETISNEKMSEILVSCDEHGAMSRFDVMSETIGQYTGLKDIHENEIYEGDLVRSYGGESYQGVWEHDEICLVEWVGNGFDLVSKDGSGNGWGFVDCGENVHIIGNIYENQNMFKKGETKCNKNQT